MEEPKANIQWEQQKLANKIQKAFSGFFNRTGIVVKNVETKVESVETLENGDLKINQYFTFIFQSPLELKVDGKAEKATDMGFDTSEKR